MNVIIMQIKGRKAIALNSEGEYITITAQKGMKTGSSFLYEKPASRAAFHPFSTIAASLLILLSGTALWMSFAVSTYIDVNINPGVRIALNAFGRVVKTEAINSDGQKLLSGLKTNLFTTAENELIQVINQAIYSGYLKNSSGVLITISDDNPRRAEAEEKVLFSTSLQCLQDKNIQAAVKTQKISREALDALRRQVNTGSDTIRDRYQDKAWHTSSNPLYIERAETIGKDTIRIIFSRDISYTGDEKIVLADQQGNTYDNQAIDRNGDEWLLQCKGLLEGRGYYLSITNIEDYPSISAFLMITDVNANDTGSKNEDRENLADDGNTGDDGQHSKRPDITPSASPDSDNDEMDAEQPEEAKTAQPSPAPRKTRKPTPTSPGNEEDNDTGSDEGNSGENRIISTPTPFVTPDARDDESNDEEQKDGDEVD